MKQHRLVLLNTRGIAFASLWNPYGTYQYGSFSDGYSFTPSYVVNGANPQAKIKHIMACAKLLDGYA